MAVIQVILENGTVADANEVMDNFYEIYSNITNDNVAANAAILWAKMQDLPLNWILVGNGANKAEPSATLPAAVVGAIDHNSLANLTVGDPHTQYILVAGTRAFTANQSMGGFLLTNLGAPVGANDAARKDYVDTLRSEAVLRDGTQAFTADQSMGNNQLTNVANPLAAQDAATKDYVDSALAGTYVTLATNQTITGDKTMEGELAIDNGGLLTGNEAGSWLAVANIPAEPDGSVPNRVVNAWSQCKAYTTFTDTGAAINLGNTYNIDTVTEFAGTYTITFAFPFADTNYCILFGAPAVGNGLRVPSILGRNVGSFTMKLTEITDVLGATVTDAVTAGSDPVSLGVFGTLDV